MMRVLIILIAVASLFLHSCGIYSLSGATVDGKTMYVHMLENRARNVVPSLSATLTDKIRNRISSQTGLLPVRTDEADYDISGTITAYEVTVVGVQNTQTAAKNRLTIELQIVFKNRKNEKANFTQAFKGSSDFDASQILQSVETRLIDDIGNRLADDIFNKGFVNW